MASRDLEEADPPTVFEVDTQSTDESSPLLSKGHKPTQGHKDRSYKVVQPVPEEEPVSTANDEEIQAAPGTASIISLLLIGTVHLSHQLNSTLNHYQFLFISL